MFDKMFAQLGLGSIGSKLIRLLPLIVACLHGSNQEIGRAYLALDEDEQSTIHDALEWVHDRYCNALSILAPFRPPLRVVQVATPVGAYFDQAEDESRRPSRRRRDRDRKRRRKARDQQENQPGPFSIFDFLNQE